jgi:hypothetical protein
MALVILFASSFALSSSLLYLYSITRPEPLEVGANVIHDDYPGYVFQIETIQPNGLVDLVSFRGGILPVWVTDVCPSLISEVRPVEIN